MATYVLVHGAWSGSWGFKDVAGRLRAAGHAVYTPSLTGIGERSHLANPDVDLSLHIKDVEQVLWYEDLSDIVLLGFSYGGMVVTGLVDRCAERISHLVYLDALLPEDGQSSNDINGRNTEGESWTVPPRPRQLADPEMQAWMDARRVPQPRKTFEEKVRLSKPLAEHAFSLTYIKATADPPPGPLWGAAARVRNDPRWRYREVPTGHMVALTMPAELTALLLELA
jgi:pimeloyl-ACP methyl ester carboxylesterase